VTFQARQNPITNDDDALAIGKLLDAVSPKHKPQRFDHGNCAGGRAWMKAIRSGAAVAVKRRLKPITNTHD
jgi:hypothetical protein